MPPTPRELDEDSGFGAEASQDADTSQATCDRGSNVVTVPALGATSGITQNTNNNVNNRTSTIGSVTNSDTESRGSTSNKVWERSPSSPTVLMVTSSSAACYDTSNCVVSQSIPPSIQFKQVKRRLNLLSNRNEGNSTGATLIQVPFLLPLQPSEADVQRPPAKKQATLKRKQSLCVKRLSYPKSPQLSRLKQVIYSY